MLAMLSFFLKARVFFFPFSNQATFFMSICSKNQGNDRGWEIEKTVWIKENLEVLAKRIDEHMERIPNLITFFVTTCPKSQGNDDW